MNNWLKATGLTSLIFLSTNIFGQKYLSLEEAKSIATNEAYSIKHVNYDYQRINEDIKVSKKQIYMPVGSTNWSINKDLRHIVSFSAGLDWKYGRGAALKYHKNRLESHIVNTSFVDASIQRDVSIRYREAEANLEMITIYETQLKEIQDIKNNTSDSIMKKAIYQTFVTDVEEINNKIIFLRK